MKKPASPRKEDGKDGSKSAADKTACEAARKKITKPTPATAAPAKSSAKPAKTTSVPSKQSPQAKLGPKQKSTTESSIEKGSPKSRGAVKNSAAVASKKAGTKGKETVYNKNIDPKGAVSPPSSAAFGEHKESSTEPLSSDHKSSTQPRGQAGGDSLCLPLNSSPNQSPQKTNIEPGKIDRAVAESSLPPATNNIPRINSVNADPCKQTEASKGKRTPGSAIPAYLSAGQVHELSSPKDTELPLDTPCSLGSTDTPLEDSWSGIHHQVSPESETGSNTTSSDDIKPRSEDYDAGGSQDDDCSNDRGVSKCGTMRCHDFLGRSSSDTSTPEELKMYEGGAGLRVEVRLRGREAETTSEEEGVRPRPRSWLHRDELPVEEEPSEVEATGTVKSVLDHQLFSSEEEEEEETEDERSEVEVLPGQVPLAPAEPSPHFQGIINLAFDDDGGDQGNEQTDYQSASNFRRSVLLSVDECEELGSEEGGIQTPPHQPDDGTTPCDVFESDSTARQVNSDPPTGQQNHLSEHPESPALEQQHHTNEPEGKSIVFLTEIQKPIQEEELRSSQVDEEESSAPPLDPDTIDLPPQERPCHLDLSHTEQYSNGGLRKNTAKPSDSKRADLHLDLNEPQLTGDSPVQTGQSPAGNV